MKSFDPVSLSILLAILSMVPLLIVSCTAFLKISTVLLFLRNVLGVQQIPPNLAVYGVSLVISIFVMAPTIREINASFDWSMNQNASAGELLNQVGRAAEPIRKYMDRFSTKAQKEAFYQAAIRAAGTQYASTISRNDFLVLMPAFITSELTSAFEIGFLLALPFVIIDLVVSNILLALGMMMVSPNTIALPLKLLLFISVDGWSRLLHGLVLGYTT